MMDITEAEELTTDLVVAELTKQDEMWGRMNERADVSNGQLFHAAMAQLDALFDRQNGEPDAFDEPPQIYPEDWTGFRDYGSDVANLVVGAAFILQEIKRKILAGESTERLPRTVDNAA